MSIAGFLNKVDRAFRAGGATEHTYRPALQALMESLGPKVVVTNEPRRIECGAPDFIVAQGVAPLGYVEAKDLEADLDEVQDSEQLLRYREGLGNLILTNCLEFRWYLRGELRLAAHVAVIAKGRVRELPDGAALLAELWAQFLAAKVPIIASPRELAMRMASIARLVRTTLASALLKEKAGGPLHSQMEGFREVLLHSMTAEAFTDMYAQTICYGMFAARCNAPGGSFTRESAAFLLPKTNPFLRKIFNHLAGPDLDPRISWIVDDLAEVLARCRIDDVLREFNAHTRREDPVVHFYETFLATYDARMREARGVYYTPEAVVAYIVRAVDDVLKDTFGIEHGLADAGTASVKGTAKATPSAHRVIILDPATGTGTFLHEVIRSIHESFRGKEGLWSAYVSKHLLPRLYGFELLMAPYAVAHLKLGLLLGELGYEPEGGERLGVFLTNTLDRPELHAGMPLFAGWLAQEADAASRVKETVPVMVVLGNPPYSGHSENRSQWMQDLLDAYKDDPDLRRPAQGKWLNDDYVKFMRFAQWRVERTGHGIVAFVTNHAFLSNPTFRAMRRSLLGTFDEIYILDLHGNKKRKERGPAGDDENVFDIQQGVAISILVRSEKRRGGPVVRHADLWGTREAKYATLWQERLSTTCWTEIEPDGPLFLMVPQDISLRREYEKGWSVADVFNRNGRLAPGIVTTHDSFAISFSPDEAVAKVDELLATSTEEQARRRFKLCSQAQWQYARAKRELSASAWRKQVVPVQYRPFDVRWTVYDRNVAVHRRERVMRHLLVGANLALVTARTNKSPHPDHFFCSRQIVETKCGERTTQSFTIPLYLYPEDDLLGTTADERQPNLDPEIMDELGQRVALRFVDDGRGDLKKTFGPEDVFHYAYGLFYATEYRARYAEFLKTDFPRIIPPPGREAFAEFVRHGATLVGAHTLEQLPPRRPGFPKKGSNRVEKVRFETEGSGTPSKLFINREQYFSGVTPGAWALQIGGYRVCEQWLKHREDRELDFEELDHFRSIATAAAVTVETIAVIDDSVARHHVFPSKSRTASKRGGG